MAKLRPQLWLLSLATLWCCLSVSLALSVAKACDAAQSQDMQAQVSKCMEKFTQKHHEAFGKAKSQQEAQVPMPMPAPGRNKYQQKCTYLIDVRIFMLRLVAWVLDWVKLLLSGECDRRTRECLSSLALINSTPFLSRARGKGVLSSRVLRWWRMGVHSYARNYGAASASPRPSRPSAGCQRHREQRQAKIRPPNLNKLTEISYWCDVLLASLTPKNITTLIR